MIHQSEIITGQRLREISVEYRVHQIVAIDCLIISPGSEDLKIGNLNLYGCVFIDCTFILHKEMPMYDCVLLGEIQFGHNEQSMRLREEHALRQ